MGHYFDGLSLNQCVSGNPYYWGNPVRVPEAFMDNWRLENPLNRQRITSIVYFLQDSVANNKFHELVTYHELKNALARHLDALFIMKINDTETDITTRLNMLQTRIQDKLGINDSTNEVKNLAQQMIALAGLAQEKNKPNAQQMLSYARNAFTVAGGDAAGLKPQASDEQQRQQAQERARQEQALRRTAREQHQARVAEMRRRQQQQDRRQAIRGNNNSSTTSTITIDPTWMSAPMIKRVDVRRLTAQQRAYLEFMKDFSNGLPDGAKKRKAAQAKLAELAALNQ